MSNYNFFNSCLKHSRLLTNDIRKSKKMKCELMGIFEQLSVAHNNNELDDSQYRELYNGFRDLQKAIEGGWK